MRKARGLTEDQVQQVVLNWSRRQTYKSRPLFDYLHHSPNGGSRHSLEAAKFKRMGVKAGYPDLILDIAKGGYHGLRVELKRDKRSYLTKMQKERIQMLNDEGYLAVVAKGVDEAIETIQTYLNLKDKGGSLEQGVAK